MISDEEVVALYRCLLDREPENIDTINSFKQIYPTFGEGRKGILGSDEFSRRLTSILPLRYSARQAAQFRKGDHPPIALAVIVRNECKCVASMLASALPLCSFAAVLDTGSTDGTFAIVETFLATHRDSIDGVLREDATLERFDDMRNKAISLVPAAYEWILMLDADEEVVAEDFPLFIELMKDGSLDGYLLPRYNFSSSLKDDPVHSYPDRQARFFRNRPDVRYSGAVHETIRGVPLGTPSLNGESLGFGSGGPHIHHLVRRYRTPSEEEAKQERYRQIARSFVEGS